jgi:ubiquinone/menaquinone biosynthesis C-methylase UbiE
MSRVVDKRAGTVFWFSLIAFACFSAVAAAQQTEFERDATRLATALNLRAGHSVADIGAGEGELAIALADAVGPNGSVYATEIGEDRLKTLRTAVATSERSNITVVEAHAIQTNLPPACCDALIMRLVYHHFRDPATMNRSLFASVKPGGVVAVLDFPSENGKTAAPSARAENGNHGVDAATVVEELTAAGFERVLVDAESKPRYLVVMRRPM